jgi:hypothetical protein
MNPAPQSGQLNVMRLRASALRDLMIGHWILITGYKKGRLTPEGFLSILHPSRLDLQPNIINIP